MIHPLRTPRRLRLIDLSVVALIGCLGCEDRAEDKTEPKPAPAAAEPPAASAPKTKPTRVVLNPPQTPAGSVPAPAERPAMYAPRPYLSLKVDIDECAFDVYLNGGLVTANLAGTAHEEQPVNHWLRSGTNALEVYMYKPEDEPDHCDVNLRLSVLDKDDDQKPPATVLVLAHSAKAAAAGDHAQGSSPPGRYDSSRGFRRSDAGDVTVGPVELTQLTGQASEIHVLRRTFDIQVPFPEWAFFRGDKVKQWFEFESREKRRPMYDEILRAYSELWALLDKRDVRRFLNACEERSREIDLAFYKKPGTTRARLRDSLESAMNDPKYELATLGGPGFWTYTVGSTGKLIALTQGDRASPIFRYVLKSDTPFSLIFPIVFRKEGDQYIVTR